MNIIPGMGQDTPELEKRIIVAGVGLIGGSIAAAIRKRDPDCEVIGVGRCEARLTSAAKAGLLTDWSTQYSEDLFADRCCVVVCLPVHLIGREVCRIAELAGAEVLITDAGSVKAMICAEVAQHGAAAERFVGAHPIAGGEQGGFEHADAKLFQNRVCVVTKPGSSSAAEQLAERARRFWQQIGCRIVDMTPEDHDRVLALTSHLPHLMAAVTTAVVGQENFSLAGSGFRDATRIAAGDAQLWTAIMAGNRDPLMDAVRSAEHHLAKYRMALETRDDRQLMALLSGAAEQRRQLDNS